MCSAYKGWVEYSLSAVLVRGFAHSVIHSLDPVLLKVSWSAKQIALAIYHMVALDWQWVKKEGKEAALLLPKDTPLYFLFCSETGFLGITALAVLTPKCRLASNWELPASASQVLGSKVCATTPCYLMTSQLDDLSCSLPSPGRTLYYFVLRSQRMNKREFRWQEQATFSIIWK